MALRVTPDVLVLALPIVLLVLLTPFSWSADGLGPGCHLLRERAHTHTCSHTYTLTQPTMSPESRRHDVNISFKFILYSGAPKRWLKAPTLYIRDILSKRYHDIWMDGWCNLYLDYYTRDQELFAHPNTLPDKIREVLRSNPYSFSLSRFLCYSLSH